jgi:hypothetical protein
LEFKSHPNILQHFLHVVVTTISTLHIAKNSEYINLYLRCSLLGPGYETVNGNLQLYLVLLDVCKFSIHTLTLLYVTSTSIEILHFRCLGHWISSPFQSLSRAQAGKRYCLSDSPQVSCPRGSRRAVLVRQLMLLSTSLEPATRNHYAAGGGKNFSIFSRICFLSAPPPRIRKRDLELYLYVCKCLCICMDVLLASA